MVLHDDGGPGIVCVGQASHAWISGQLGRAWGNDAFARPDPHEEFCLGAEQHDVGMAEWDLSPTLNPQTGRPTAFTEMPRPLHLELWSRAPAKLLTQSPYAALLVSLHGHALYARHPEPDHAEAVAGFLARQEALQGELLEALAEDPERARRNQRLLWALDYLSLALLIGWTSGVEAPTGPGEPDVKLDLERREDGTYTISPWPLAPQRLQVCCQGRRLIDRAQTQGELDAALAAAPWVTLRFELAADPPA